MVNEYIIKKKMTIFYLKRLMSVFWENMYSDEFNTVAGTKIIVAVINAVIVRFACAGN
jgi:hypothetical protein